jgi:hypothetical protein
MRAARRPTRPARTAPTDSAADAFRRGGRLNARPGLSQIPGAGGLSTGGQTWPECLKVFGTHRKAADQDIESSMKQFRCHGITKTAGLNVRCNYSLVRYYVISMSLLYRHFYNLTGEQINSR